MNTYVIPLNCERKEDDPNAHQLAMFVCRTMQDDQYCRISFQGESIRRLGGWDIADAKVSTIFVTNDAHVLDLAPHSGLPTVHIDSNLHAWSLRPRGDSRRAILEPELMNRGRELTTIASPNEQPTVPPVPPARHDLESGTARNNDLRGSGPVQGAFTVQKQVSQVQFCPQDLKKGRVVAFTRMSTSRAEFYYYVELGFDMEFNPVCFLHVRRFTTVPGLWSHWLGAYRTLFGISILLLLFPEVKWTQQLPICGSFWNDKRCRRVKSKLDERIKVFFRRHIYLSSRSREACTFCSASEVMEDHTGTEMIIDARAKDPMKVGMGFDVRARHQDPLLWKFTGHRADGFEEHIKKWLPCSHGCVSVKVTCRPRNPDAPGLDWLLTLREEPLHPGALRHGVFCWQRMMPTMYVWYRTIRLNLLAAISTLTWLAAIGLAIQGICADLGADISLRAAIGIWCRVVALLLVIQLFEWCIGHLMDFNRAPRAYVKPQRYSMLWLGVHKQLRPEISRPKSWSISPS